MPERKVLIVSMVGKAARPVVRVGVCVTPQRPYFTQDVPKVS